MWNVKLSFWIYLSPNLFHPYCLWHNSEPIMFESHGESTRSTYIQPKAGVIGSWLIEDLAVRLPSHGTGTIRYFCSDHSRNWRTRLNFNFCQRVYQLLMRRLLLSKSKWHLPAKLPRIHATAPLPYKILDDYCVHTAPVKFIFQKFWRSWCFNTLRRLKICDATD